MSLSATVVEAEAQAAIVVARLEERDQRLLQQLAEVAELGAAVAEHQAAPQAAVAEAAAAAAVATMEEAGHRVAAGARLQRREGAVAVAAAAAAMGVGRRAVAVLVQDARLELQLGAVVVVVAVVGVVPPGGAEQHGMGQKVGEEEDEDWAEGRSRGEKDVANEIAFVAQVPSGCGGSRPRDQKSKC